MNAARLHVRTLMKAAGAITAAFAAFMVLVHLPAGRRLLAPFYGAKCPVGGGGTPESVENARVQAVKQIGGEGIASARPALGFELEKSRADDIHAWAAAKGVACKDERQGALIRCTTVAPNALVPALEGPPLTEVLFAFEPRSMTLVNMTAYYEGVPEEVAATRGHGMTEHLKRTLGAPEKQVGEFERAFLAGEGFPVALVSYRFANYHASVTATRMRPGAIMLREQYMAGAPADADAGR